MNELIGLTLCFFLSIAGQGATTAEEQLLQPDEFVSYWSPVGFHVTIKSSGQLLSELMIPPGVWLEIRAKQSSNPNPGGKRPVVFHGTVHMQSKVDTGPKGVRAMVQVMQGRPGNCKSTKPRLR